MRTILIILGIVAVLLIAAFAVGLIDLDQTQEAVLPEVSIEGGQLPEVEVETGSIELGTETETIEVERPTLDIVPADAEEAGN